MRADGSGTSDADSPPAASFRWTRSGDRPSRRWRWRTTRAAEPARTRRRPTRSRYGRIPTDPRPSPLPVHRRRRGAVLLAGANSPTRRCVRTSSHLRPLQFGNGPYLLGATECIRDSVALPAGFASKGTHGRRPIGIRRANRAGAGALRRVGSRKAARDSRFLAWAIRRGRALSSFKPVHAQDPRTACAWGYRNGTAARAPGLRGRCRRGWTTRGCRGPESGLPRLRPLPASPRATDRRWAGNRVR